MKNSNKIIANIAAFGALLFSGYASAAPLTTTLDFTSVEIDAAAPYSFDFSIAETGTITDIVFDFDYFPQTPSWSEELEMTLTGPGYSLTAGSENSGDGPFDIDFGAPDNSSDPFSVILLSSSLFNGFDPLGDWNLTITENFDDTGIDGIFGSEFAQIYIDYDSCEQDCGGDDPTGVPEPGTLLLLGMGLTGLSLARRRRLV